MTKKQRQAAIDAQNAAQTETQTQEQSEDHIPESNGVVNSAKKPTASKIMYASIEEAKAASPPTGAAETFRIYEVKAKDHPTRYTWAISALGALQNASRADGYEAGIAEPKHGGGPRDLTKAVVQMTEEQFQALLAAREAARTSTRS